MGQKIIPVVVSGGAGTRLWPLSTDDKPKQFHRLGGQGTLLQETIARFHAFEGLRLEPPILVSNARYAEVARRQMDEAGCSPLSVVLEPFGRNTAAVAMAASLIAAETDPDALILMMPADHLMTRPEAFGAAIIEAAPLAETHFVLFGVIPTTPETGFGYIAIGEPLAGPVSRVGQFVEKPKLDVAEAFLKGRRHLWNAGIFLFRPALMMQEMERLAPDVAKATREAVRLGARRDGTLELDAAAFQACPSISIDYAVMEHTDRAAVIPIDAGWADIGSWSSVLDQGPLDADGNRLEGHVVAIDSEGCLVWSEGPPIGVVGMKDIIVVQSAAGLIVLPRSRAQDIKAVVERLKEQAR